MRSRLLLATALGTGLVLSASGLLLYVLARRLLVSEFDSLLIQNARALAALVEQDGARVDLEFDHRGEIDDFRRAERPSYYQVWLDDGTVVARSPSLGERTLPLVAGPEAEPACRFAVLPDGRPGRLAGLQFYPRVETPEQGGGEIAPRRQVTLVVARTTIGIVRTLTSLQWLLGGVGFGALLISLAVLAWVVHRGLRPLERIARDIARVGEEDLSSRIDLESLPPELVPIGRKLNDLLARLERAFQRERSFSSDVSHELRTPLAGLRATLEVALRGAREPTTCGEAMTDCLGICQQMQWMVESLLEMSRIEARQLLPCLQPVQVDELLRECWAPLSQRARERRLEVAWRLEQPITVVTDRDRLRLVIHNVLDNAVSHADSGSRVVISAETKAGNAGITVCNTGSRLSPEDMTHVFERFWRGDSAREATGVHCGLGLSLSKQLVELLGGSISAESDPEGTFSLAIVLPPNGAAPVESA